MRCGHFKVGEYDVYLGGYDIKVDISLKFKGFVDQQVHMLKAKSGSHWIR